MCSHEIDTLSELWQIIKTMIWHVLEIRIPVQVGAVPFHTPTALRPSPVIHILTLSPPFLSMPSGQLMVYNARIPKGKGELVSGE